MAIYQIHPIVLGTKIFDKGMMTYQHDYGREYVIPIYAWYLEDFIEEVEDNGQLRIVETDRDIRPCIRVVHTPAHTRGGLSVLVATEQGQAAITGFWVIEENFKPPPAVRAMELAVIPPGTAVNPCRANDIMLDLQKQADILIPLHKPRVAAVDTVVA